MKCRTSWQINPTRHSATGKAKQLPHRWIANQSWAADCLWWWTGAWRILRLWESSCLAHKAGLLLQNTAVGDFWSCVSCVGWDEIKHWFKNCLALIIGPSQCVQIAVDHDQIMRSLPLFIIREAPATLVKIIWFDIQATRWCSERVAGLSPWYSAFWVWGVCLFSMCLSWYSNCHARQAAWWPVLELNNKKFPRYAKTGWRDSSNPVTPTGGETDWNWMDGWMGGCIAGWMDGFGINLVINLVEIILPFFFNKFLLKWGCNHVK